MYEREIEREREIRCVRVHVCIYERGGEICVMCECLYVCV